MEKNNDAINDYSCAIQNQTKNPFQHLLLGLVYYTQKQLSFSKQYLQKAQELSKNLSPKDLQRFNFSQGNLIFINKQITQLTQKDIQQQTQKDQQQIINNKILDRDQLDGFIIEQKENALKQENKSFFWHLHYYLGAVKIIYTWWNNIKKKNSDQEWIIYPQFYKHLHLLHQIRIEVSLGAFNLIESVSFNLEEIKDSIIQQYSDEVANKEIDYEEQSLIGYCLQSILQQY
ncbi:unnamed protein product [Paramecium sonneborni]|uniref:Tetratricopeptide repeat protein n=1 Tax=Paramecium sonneborni TaxID=65129 RepID=A0A8S1RVS7_9CILI|nr:unnamed protein product [Paramecium sonneborni]CAD8131065.1 unnamed protein product [Paramecium sonneborni]